MRPVSLPAASRFPPASGNSLLKRRASKGAAAQVELHEQANEEMIVAIEDIDGISPDEYLEIASAATNDPALIERIVTLMETDPTSLQ